MSDTIEQDSPAADPAAALKEAMAKEHTVTSWISVDVEQLRKCTQAEVVGLIVGAGERMAHALASELRKHGIDVTTREIRAERRRRR